MPVRFTYTAVDEGANQPVDLCSHVNVAVIDSADDLNASKGKSCSESTHNFVNGSGSAAVTRVSSAHCSNTHCPSSISAACTRVRQMYRAKVTSFIAEAQPHIITRITDPSTKTFVYPNALPSLPLVAWLGRQHHARPRLYLCILALVFVAAIAITTRQLRSSANAVSLLSASAALEVAALVMLIGFMFSNRHCVDQTALKLVITSFRFVFVIISLITATVLYAFECVLWNSVRAPCLPSVHYIVFL